MWNLKPFSAKLNIILIVVFFIFLLVIPCKFSEASCCYPYDGDPVIEEDYEFCPSSGEACTFTVTTRRWYETGCETALNCQTTVPNCYLKPLIPDGETIITKSPFPFCDECYRVIGGDHCSTRNPRNITKITIYYSWVSYLGTKNACQDLQNCFYCYVKPGQSPTLPECGYQFKNCPFG